MTCEEFEQVLPESEGDRTIERESHLESCAVCSELIADLEAISLQARLLQDSDEPSPRVWNSIEIALRQEGLIREKKSFPFLLPKLPPRNRLAWLIPATTAALLMFGAVYYGRLPVRTSHESAALPAVDLQVADNSAVADQQLLDVVSQRTPQMLASYKANLQDVNSYIRDAQQSVRTNPNDEQAQQYLMSAYEQKSMVYQMALDRSLP